MLSGLLPDHHWKQAPNVFCDPVVLGTFSARGSAFRPPALLAAGRLLSFSAGCWNAKPALG